MFRVLTIIVFLTLVVGGFLLAILNDEYRIVDTLKKRFLTSTTSLAGDACFAALEKRGIQFKKLGKAGTEVCPVLDAVKIRIFPNTKMSGAVTLNCNTALNIADWFEEIEAKDVQHMGSYNCRKIANTDIWSQHSFGTALDIASINGASLKRDWFTDSTKSEYLRKAAFVACDYFANVLTPDYNAAHHDHFHLDHGPRYSSCDPEWYTFLRLQYRKLKTLF